ncbi:hypothetical protein M8818_005730 [Zalaria obscura]|uniref:Uncharacterized protein n=1 Tax=Zalaria obscura TaxID=2024903 RepID=A0ACC3SD71_9PEZI
MEVNKISFPARLLDIIVAVSEAHFVSFDLELSGVPVKQGNDRSGKASLQQRYLETKKAAEQYQILQIGLTCVREDTQKGGYVCKPYNFNLNPVVEERIDIDRTFSFHSGAVEFLLSVGFQMDLPFILGVPYLSRKEAKLAREKADARQDRASFKDIEIKAEDTETLEIFRKVRAEIERWKKTGKPYAESLNIGPTIIGGTSEAAANNELSRYEKRLVHQIVRAEFPDLVTIPKRGSIQIVKFNQEREDYIKHQRRKETRERVNRQIGFRWIIEALAGGDLHHIDIKSFAIDPETGGSVFADLDDYRSKMTRAQSRIKGRPTVIVGHNCFLDLVYIYRTFIGDLPDTVEEFQELLHEVFPVIVDTKYLATHNCGDVNPMSSLEQIAEQLNYQDKPLVETHPNHSKYELMSAFHEAGYDSFLTAQVAIRLSAKLEAAGCYIEVDGSAEDGQSEPEEAGGVKLDGGAPDFTPGSIPQATDTLSYAISGFKGLLLAPVKALTGDGKASIPKDVGSERKSTKAAATSAETGGVDGSAESSSSKQKNKKSKNKNKNNVAPRPGPASAGRFAHATAFDHFRDSPSDEEETEEEEVLDFDNLQSSDVPAATPVVSDTDGVTAPNTWGSVMEEWVPMRLMPRFDSDFWKVYGNKLRVFGTVEGMCPLDS